MKTYLILLFFFFFSQSHLFSQKEHHIWYFGFNGGIEFNSGSPPSALINGALSTTEGCASISDYAGNLLFYTEGTTVWNSNHLTMTNGTGLLGHFSSSQSAIIVPNPADTAKYYIFTIDQVIGGSMIPGNGLRYSEVDMNLSAGLGAVTNKNIRLKPIWTTEKITAVPHANGKDFWVITHELGTDAFYTYQITSAGIDTVPIISNVGRLYQGPPLLINWDFQGYLKASTDGKKLASANNTPFTAGFIEVYDFDNTNGVISNPLLLSSPSGNPTYGVEFSPNGRFLYGANFTREIYQYDLHAGSASTIMANRILVTDSAYGSSALQLGPDQKIYSTGVAYLHTIDQPNVLAPGCNFTKDAIYLNSGLSRAGLPNAIGKSPLPLFEVKNSCLGDTTFFTFKDTSGIDSISWCFGDPASGALNFSNQTEPFHIFPDTGYYWIKVIMKYSIFPGITVLDSLQRLVKIIASPNVDLGPDTLLCIGETITYNVSHPHVDNYRWQNNDSTAIFTVDQTGKYWVESSNICGSSADTVEVTYIESLKIPYNFTDTLICEGDSFRVNAFVPEVSYLWQDSSIQPFLDITSNGLYWVEWKNNCEQLRDSFNIGWITHQFDDIELGPDTSICEGDTLWLVIPGSGLTYTWQNQSKDSMLLVNQAGTYWVEVKNSCETKTDRIRIDEKNCDCTWKIYNVLTPNSDQLNDEFKVEPECDILDFELTIFDRWGTTLYHNKNPEKGWDGTFSGKELPQGVYLWTAQFKYSTAQKPKEQILKGAVHLYR